MISGGRILWNAVATYWRIRGQASRDSHIIERDSSRRIYVVRGETGKKSHDITSRSHIWPDAWTRIGKVAQRRENQEWTIEKPTLEHARDLRRIYTTDPSDEEYKDIVENARRKLETSKAVAMPRKRAFPQACITGNRCFRNRKSQGI